MSTRNYTVNPTYYIGNYLKPQFDDISGLFAPHPQFGYMPNMDTPDFKAFVPAPNNAPPPPNTSKGFNWNTAGKVAGYANAGIQAFNAFNTASNDVGNAFSTAGGIIGSIPTPYTAVAGAILSGVGAIANGFTNTVNHKHADNIGKQLTQLAHTTSDASTYGELMADYDSLNQNDVELGDISSWGSKGIFSSGSRRKRARAKAVKAKEVAKMQAMNNLSQQGRNINQSNMFNMYTNLIANGGPLNMRHTEVLSPFGNRFDDGGFTNGITQINEGGTHEANPLGGVPLGVDNAGVPNLVEEGEVVWNDYVFSDRLKVPKSFKDKYKLKSKKPLSFAEAANKFTEEIKERPNDPISKRGRDTMLSLLRDQQEEVRVKKQQREAVNTFNSLPPEDQLGIMQMAQQQGIPNNPEENINAGNDIYNQDVPLMAAYGGELGNIFEGKGNKSNRMTRKYNLDWFKKRAAALGFELGDNFDFDPKNYDLNLSNFNSLYEKYQRQKALDTYLAGKRQEWINSELKSGRFRRGDDGKNVYAAKFYGDDDLGKDYISSTGRRITTAEYNILKEAYDKLAAKNNRTAAEEEILRAFQNASYKASPVVKGQFVRDYNGNIVYDYNNDVSSTWLPLDATLEKGFKWDSSNAAKISYDGNKSRSAASALRYAPAVGSAIGVLTDALGITNKPDYSNADAIEQAYNMQTPTIGFTPIGDYIKKRQFDRNYYLNQLRSSSASTQRAIMNQSSGNIGATTMGLLANAYNTLENEGKLARQAEEFAMQEELQRQKFNRETNMFNSQMRMNADKANQAAYMSSLQAKAEGVYKAASLRAAEQAQSNAARSANYTNLVNSLGQIGEESYNKDMLQALIDRGVIKDIFDNGGVLNKRKKRRRK